MTTRHAGYIITLAADIRDDDAEDLIVALRQLRGVSIVTPVEADAKTKLGQARADSEWRMALVSLAEKGPE